MSAFKNLQHRQDPEIHRDIIDRAQASATSAAKLISAPSERTAARDLVKRLSPRIKRSRDLETRWCIPPPDGCRGVKMQDGDQWKRSQERMPASPDRPIRRESKVLHTSKISIAPGLNPTVDAIQLSPPCVSVTKNSSSIFLVRSCRNAVNIKKMRKKPQKTSSESKMKSR